MNIDRVINAMAGTFILLSLLLSRNHSPYWLWFTALLGLNILRSSFIEFCPTVKRFKALEIKPGSTFK